MTPVLQKQLTRHTENSYKLVGTLQQKPRPTAKQLAAVALLSGGERTQNEMEAHGITKAVLDNLCLLYTSGPCYDTYVIILL